MRMIEINPQISIAQWEISETVARASGPGGQHVNKVSTAVTLRFEAMRSPHLTPAIKSRLQRLAGRRMTQEGAILITAQQHRSQLRNREDAMQRLVALIQSACVVNKARKATRPTYGSTQRRLASKTKHGQLKRLRGNTDD